MAIVATLPVGRAPFALTVSPDATRVYVANVQSADLSVISTETLQPIGTVKVGPMPYGLATSLDGTRLLVVNQSAGSVSLLDTADMRVLATHKVGRFPEGLVVEPQGHKAYVANWFSGDVSVLDVASGKELKRIKTGGGSRALAVAVGNAHAPFRKGDAVNVSGAAFVCLALASATLTGGATAHAQQSQPCTEDAMLVFDASKSMAAAAGDNTGLRRIDSVRTAARPHPAARCPEAAPRPHHLRTRLAAGLRQRQSRVPARAERSGQNHVAPRSR